MKFCFVGETAPDGGIKKVGMICCANYNYIVCKGIKSLEHSINHTLQLA